MLDIFDHAYAGEQPAATTANLIDIADSRQTTVMGRVPKRLVDETLWPRYQRACEIVGTMKRVFVRRTDHPPE